MRRIALVLVSACSLLAVAVAGFAVGGTGTVEPPPRIAFLANGVVPADALAAGGIAGQLGAPLFTTRADALEPSARDGIRAHAPELVIVLGGPVAISDDVITQLSRDTGLPVQNVAAPADGIVRVAGADRFATAAAVAGLLEDYAPAYLPADATAREAIDADTVDGLDADAFVAKGEIVVNTLTWVPSVIGAEIELFNGAARIDDGNAVAAFQLPAVLDGPVAATEVVLCIESGGVGIGASDVVLTRVDDEGNRDVTTEDMDWSSGDSGCQTHQLGGGDPVPLDETSSVTVRLSDNSPSDEVVVTRTSLRLIRTG